jgi:NitT/TauT family transport system ATP-binding protein
MDVTEAYQEPQDPVLLARDLSVVFPNGNGGLPALQGVSFSAGRNAFLCIVGPSGCGKSTLLRLLAGLLQPTRGEVILEGRRVDRPRRVGFVFQQANLMPWRTALDNVALPLELSDQPVAERIARAGELMQLVGLTGFEDSLPRDLSGGMAQRVAIARALIHHPDLLLLDEPLGSLDAMTREWMGFELMRIWSNRPVTVVMVTHSIPEAVLLADRVLVLSRRPGSVRLDLHIPLERPRTLSMAHTPEFGRLSLQIRQAIGA